MKSSTQFHLNNDMLLRDYVTHIDSFWCKKYNEVKFKKTFKAQYTQQSYKKMVRQFRQPGINCFAFIEVF